MFNVYKDFGDQGLTPYVGVGLGAANVELNAQFTPPLIPVAIDDDAVTFPYQIMAGLSYQLTPGMDIDLGYRSLTEPALKKTKRPPADQLQWRPMSRNRR